MIHLRNFALASLASLATLSISAPSFADNPDRFYMSTDAALQAGAITADTRDTGSVWYNPAGLAQAKGQRFDVNVSAYALQLGGVPKLDAIGPDAKAETVGVLNFAAVPTAFASLKTFEGITVAVGVFVPQMGVDGVRSRVTSPATEDRTGIEFDLNNYKTSQELYGGPGIGWHVAPGVDFGMSLFIHYRAILASEEVRVVLTDGQETDLVSGRALADWLQLGVAPTMGVQLQLSPRWRYGMLLRLPSIRFLQLLGYSETLTTTVGGDTQVSAEFKDETDFDTRFLTPGRMNAGLSYTWNRTHYSLEGSYQMPYRNKEVQQNLRPTINARFGVRHQVHERMDVGGGFFTNMSTTKNLENLGDSKLNFYGLTLAMQTGSSFTVSEQDGKKLDKPGKMQFGSSFAFSYAMGIGQTLHGYAGSSNNVVEIYKQESVNVIAHEWIFSVGGSIFQN